MRKSESQHTYIPDQYVKSAVWEPWSVQHSAHAQCSILLFWLLTLWVLKEASLTEHCREQQKNGTWGRRNGKNYYLFYIREGYKVRKAKKMTKILHLGFLIPPPPKCRKIQPIIFKLLASFWATLEKFIFSPWKSKKTIIKLIFSQNWSSEGGWGPPLTPLTKGKIFLCISGRIGPFYTL